MPQSEHDEWDDFSDTTSFFGSSPVYIGKTQYRTILWSTMAVGFIIWSIMYTKRDPTWYEISEPWAIAGFLMLLIYMAIVRARFSAHKELSDLYPILKTNTAKFFLYFFVPVVNLFWMIALTRAFSNCYCLWYNAHAGAQAVDLRKCRASICKSCAVVFTFMAASLVYALATMPSSPHMFTVVPFIPCVITTILGSLFHSLWSWKKPVHRALIEEYYLIFSQILMFISIVYKIYSSSPGLTYPVSYLFWGTALDLGVFAVPVKKSFVKETGILGNISDDI